VTTEPVGLLVCSCKTWTLTGPEHYERLVHDWGWTHEEYVELLRDSFAAVLRDDK
jgi:hypothetical protein